MARKLVPLILTVAQTKEPFDAVRWRAHRHVGAAAEVRGELAETDR